MKVKEGVFPARLRQARLNRGLLQRDLAIRSGVSERQISFYETGRVFPTIPCLLKLCRSLGVGADHLLGIGG